MQSFDKLLPQIREGNLELHCIDVKIWQESGIELFGHGTIRINKHGILYLEFICTQSNNLPPLSLLEKFPKDNLNDKEIFYLECETLAGEILKASKFSVDIGLGDRSLPNKKSIILNNVQCEETDSDEDDDNFLFFEFSEHCDLPANKSNSETSTPGYESHSRNQSIIEMNGLSISIVDKKEYTYVRVTGEFDVSRVLECLNFYIVFTCGSMIQPIATVQRNKQQKISTINSIRNIQKRQRSSNPVPSNYGKKKVESNYHYQVFKSIYTLHETSPENFESIYSQWARVWYSFQSKNSITILTLSVAVEGLLNDIFIPKFKKLEINKYLNDEISRIKSLISSLDITPDQMSRLKGSISYWKNITAAKALDYLVSLKIISQEEKKSWSKLRNSSAHPKTKEMNVAALEAERDDLLLCLNLFHNLIFNTIQYSGPRYYWAVNCNNQLRLINHIEINEGSKQFIEPKT